MWWSGWSVAGQVYPFKVNLFLPRVAQRAVLETGSSILHSVVDLCAAKWEGASKLLFWCVQLCLLSPTKKTQRWKMAGTRSHRHWGTVHTLFCRGCGHQAPRCASSCPTSCHSKEIPQFLMSFWSCPCQKLGFSIWRMKLMSSFHFSRF